MNSFTFKRSLLRGSSAFSALAMLGAGLAGSMIVAAPAAAQDFTNVSASGRVQGTNGEPVSNATITVTSEGQGFTRQAQTDSSGAFTINQLPTGLYTFSIEAPGFETLNETGVAITRDNSANEFTIAATGAAAAAADAGDEIVVTGRRRIVDFAANTTGTVIELGELATRVPVARDITSVVLLSPGTAAGDTSFGNLASINGASVSENVFYINGLNITQFRNGLGAVAVPFDFIGTVEVLNGGIPAEFGRTTGGIVNQISKRGSNEFHGSVTFNWEPQDLRSSAPNTYATDEDSRYLERKDTILQLSGPIIKDHLFFYGIYNFRDVQSGAGFTATGTSLDPRINPATGLPRTQTATQLAQSCFINPTMCSDFGDLRNANLQIQGSQFLRDRNRSPFYGGKIDAVLGRHRLEGTYFNTSGVTNRNVFGTSIFTLASGLRYNPNTNQPGGYASSTVFRSGGENYVGRYTGSFTDWLTLSAAYGVNKNSDTTESNTPDFPSIIDQRGGGNASIGNTTANANTAFDKREFYRADVDLTFNMFGSHHVRFGYDRENLNLRNFINANGGFQFTLAQTGAAAVDPVTGLGPNTQYALARTFVSGGEFNTRNEAFYIQDSWRLLGDRLQLNIGARNDRFVNRNAAGESFYSSGSQWAPRIGISGDPFGDGRSKAYGSFSRYILPVALNTNLRLAGSELDYDAYYRLTGSGLDANGIPTLGAPITTGPGFEACPPGGPAGTACVVRNDGSVPGTESTVASNLRSQSTDEIILGFEHRFANRIRLNVFGTYTKLTDSLEDASVDQAIIPLCVSAGNTAASCRAIYNGVHQYVLINPGRDVSVTLSDPFPNETTARTVTLAAADLGYPLARRSYKAVTVEFEREFDGKWSLEGSYTWSKTRGNIEGGVRSDNGQTDSGLTTSFDLPALANGSFGYLPNDRRHNFKIFGSYQAFDWLTLGLNAQILSPRRFGCIGRAPANADNNIAGLFYGANAFYCNVDAGGNVVRNPNTSAPGAFPVTPFPVLNPLTGVSSLQLTPRASQFKSDWLYNLNLDAALRVPTDKFDAVLRVSVFNVLNRKAALDFNEFGTVNSGAPSFTYGLRTASQAPRFFRLQFSVGF
ncbi:MAG TPA: carboxypeptidase regulatory-like domain-containing protein [Allosphingosinicella sp.]